MRPQILRSVISVLTILLVSLACNISSKVTQPPTTSLSTQEQGYTQPAASLSSISQSINATLGGKVELLTPKGDQITLTIPPLALPETTEITLTALASPPQNPIANTFFAGVMIQPDQLKLRLPATRTFTLAGQAPDPVSMLFYVKQPDLVLPLNKQVRQEASISGNLLHFSTYTSGVPTSSEASTQSEQTVGQQGGSWQENLENTQALGEWSNTMQSLGSSDAAAQALQKAQQRLREQIECLFDLECTVVPLDPCGEYQQQLMQYYQQAVLFGFDPQDPLMTQLYSELERVLNECTNRYTLEYNHAFTVDQGGLHQEIRVTGKVLFNAPMYGVFDLGEPLKFQGQGPVDVAISGTMNSDDEVCTISGSGKHDIVISGELVANDLGEPSMDLTVQETWYTQGSMTVVCSDGDTQTVPLPSAGSQSFPLILPYVDGADYTAPNLGGVQGNYHWILHILHSW